VSEPSEIKPNLVDTTSDVVQSSTELTRWQPQLQIPLYQSRRRPARHSLGHFTGSLHS